MVFVSPSQGVRHESRVMRREDFMWSSQPGPSFVRSRFLIITGLCIAIWPVWRWIGARMMDRSDAHWESVAVITAMVFLWRDRKTEATHAPGALPIILLLTYAMTCGFAPPLVRALLAFAALATACSALWYGKRVELPICGLIMLSLPVMASLEFYVGYPLRVVVGEATAWLLHTNGIAAHREGTLLLWSGRTVAIDAPCSGVKMLWTGAYLCFAMAALMKLSAVRTLVLAVGAAVVVIAANILRATSLFYVEAGLLRAPPAAHEGIGVLMFVVAAGALASMSHRLARIQHA
jgi:exosortase/archaeosortase family protein